MAILSKADREEIETNTKILIRDKNYSNSHLTMKWLLLALETIDTVESERDGLFEILKAIETKLIGTTNRRFKDLLGSQKHDDIHRVVDVLFENETVERELSRKIEAAERALAKADCATKGHLLEIKELRRQVEANEDTRNAVATLMTKAMDSLATSDSMASTWLNRAAKRLSLAEERKSHRTLKLEPHEFSSDFECPRCLDYADKIREMAQYMEGVGESMSRRGSYVSRKAEYFKGGKE